MEGRTIVRPNGNRVGMRRTEPIRFNGGPDNCPAKPSHVGAAVLISHQLQWRAGQLSGQTKATLIKLTTPDLLQWRAGQLSGQTRRWTCCQVVPSQASMEGRTIVRPNPQEHCPANNNRLVLQWRAGQLSGQTLRQGAHEINLLLLQWRAGQLSGQTRRRSDSCRELTRASMEGRTIVRPNGPAISRTSLLNDASMEGRTIVRPNMTTTAPVMPTTLASMEGRTIVRPNTPVIKQRVNEAYGFNGGPDNCPAKHDHRLPTVHLFEASMEGRTIVRPNRL